MKRKKAHTSHKVILNKHKPSVGFSLLVMIAFFGVFFLLLTILRSSGINVLGQHTSASANAKIDSK